MCRRGSPSAWRGCSHAGLAGFLASASGKTHLSTRAVGLEAEQGEGKGRGLQWTRHGGPCYAAAPSWSVLPLHNCVSEPAALPRRVSGWTWAGSSAVALEQLQCAHGKWHMGQHVVGCSHTGCRGWAGVPSSQGNKHCKLHAAA